MRGESDTEPKTTAELLSRKINNEYYAVNVACHRWIPPSIDMGLPSMEIPTIHGWNMLLVVENRDEKYGGCNGSSFHP